MRVLIDPGSHHLLNLGDASMLHICADRLLQRRPQARVQILTTARELLAHHSPGCEPLAATGRYHWTEHAPRPAGGRRLARARLALNGRRLARAEPATRGFVDALLGADLLLMSGRGGLTDAFPEETRAVLAEVEAATSIGLPVAMLGQGVGPLENAELRARAQEVMPGVALISVREGRAAPALLEQLGVPPERITVTGDDAIELAYRARRDQLGAAVGLNFRVVDYSGVSPQATTEIAAAVQDVAKRIGAEILPVPISSHPAEDDPTIILNALSAGSSPAPEPSGAASTEHVVEMAGRCRVVVTGSYHAAVFALAQGIPAVGIARTPYYVDKMLGLRQQFGDGCRVVELEEAGSVQRIVAELDDLWERAPKVRDELIAAAERQIALSRDAHERAIALACA